jgi:hypothetical protein
LVRRVLVLSGVVTSVGLAASCALIAFDLPRWLDRPTTFAFSLLLFLLVRRALGSAERRYVERHGDTFGALLLPGLAAAVGGTVISTGLKLLVLQVFSG